MSMITLVEQASTPVTPTTGKVRVYVGTGGTLQSVDDAGVVTIYGAGLTQEQVEDYVGALLQDSSTVNVTYNDAGNAVSFDVIAGGIDHNSLANLTTGNPHTQYLLSATAATTYQPLDSDLTAIAGLSGTGIVVRTGTGTATTRTLTASTGMTVSNGDGVSGNPTVSITNSGVTAATYGSATQVPQIAINAQGQATSATNVAIAIPSTAVTDFTEAVQDVMGGELTDSSTIDFVYNDVSNTQTANVIPGGINHNLLLNGGGNTHIDHSTVSVNAGTGLTGGGDLTATRTISMPNTGTAGTYGSGSLIPVITTDAQGRVTSVTTAANTQSQWTDAGGLLTWPDDTGKDLQIRQANAGESPYIRQVRSRGTIASPTAVLTGDRLGGNGYYGWNSTGVDSLPSVSINGYASENHTSSAQGGDLAIEIIPNGSTTPVEVARISQNGNWDIQSNRITNAADPINPQDYATKAYVDADPWTELFTSSSLTSSSNTTLTAVPALAFTAVAGHVYYMEYTIRFQTAATTTGISLTLNTGTTAVGTIASQVNIPVSADGTSALYTGSISSLNEIVTSTSVEASNTNYVATIRSTFTCTTGGTIQPYFRSEVSGSQVTFGAGSFALIRDFS